MTKPAGCLLCKFAQKDSVPLQDSPGGVVCVGGYQSIQAALTSLIVASAGSLGLSISPMTQTVSARRVSSCGLTRQRCDPSPEDVGEALPSEAFSTGGVPAPGGVDPAQHAVGLADSLTSAKKAFSTVVVPDAHWTAERAPASA